MGEILTFKLNLTLKVKVNCPQNKMDLDQCLLHLWSNFGDPSLNGSRVIARTSKWLTQTDTHTHTRTHTPMQAMTIPEGQNWPRVKISIYVDGWTLRHGKFRYNLGYDIWIDIRCFLYIFAISCKSNIKYRYTSNNMFWKETTMTRV